jgi:acyl-CoA thioester hydrolase
MTQGFRQDRVVGTSDCDELGHMNVACYFAFTNRAGMAMQTAIGWPPGQANRGRRYSFAVVKSDSEFLAELHAGEEIAVVTGISAFGTKSATFHTEILRIDGTPAFRTTWKSVLMDLDTRKSTELPDDLRAALEPYTVTP